MNSVLQARRKLGTALSKSLLPDAFTIISDDCWGGQVYRQLQIPYITPTVGLWIEPKDYLTYIDQLEVVNKNDLVFVESDQDYPVAKLAGVEIHFMHFDNEQEARDKYCRRWSRINRSRLLTKIDFGKQGYTTEAIERWNEIKLPNSIAFYSPDTKLPAEGVYNGILIPDWVSDGAKMFNITRKHFNLFKWIQSGEISQGPLYRLMNVLLFDPTGPKRIVDKVASLRSSR